MPERRTSKGVTLLELIVTLTLIGILAAIMIPGWISINGTRARRGATGLVLGSLERARVAAVTGKREVWVVFRHSNTGGRDSLRIVSAGSSGLSPRGPWLSLPAGMHFQCGGGALPDVPPPSPVVAAAATRENRGEGSSPDKEQFGGIMYRPTGAVGFPNQGDSRLLIPFSAEKGPPPDTILLSRGTGRPTSGS